VQRMLAPLEAEGQRLEEVQRKLTQEKQPATLVVGLQGP
jgi:hypothetical protein